MKRFKISGCALPPVMFTKFSTSIRWDVLAFACLASASRFARLARTIWSICTATTRIPRHSGTEHRTHGKCECQIVPGSKYCHWHFDMKSTSHFTSKCPKIELRVATKFHAKWKKETSIESLGGFQLQTFKIILQSQLSLAVTSLTTCHLPPQLDRRGAFGHWPDSWDCSLLRACWEQPSFAEIGPATILVTKVGLVWWWGLWVKLLSYYYIIILSYIIHADSGSETDIILQFTSIYHSFSPQSPSFCATQACVGSNWLAAQESERSLTCCSRSLWIRFCCSIHSWRCLDSDLGSIMIINDLFRPIMAYDGLCIHSMEMYGVYRCL